MSEIDGVRRSVEVVADARELARRGAELVDAWASGDVATSGRCRLALAGGSTPLALYRLWAQQHEVDPEGLEVWYGDERCVPLDDEASNHRAAREALLDPMGVPPENVRPVEGADEDPDGAARRYANDMPERFDLVLLGIGEDGHTASLFPGDRAALEEAEARALHVVGTKPPPHRVTIAPVVLERARRVLVLASGPGKAAAVARALDPGTAPIDCPAALVRERAWLLDEGAASELERGAGDRT